MDWLYLSTVGPLIAGVANGIVGALVYCKKEKKDKSNLLFTLFILSVSAWVILVLAFTLSTNLDFAKFFAPLMYLSAAFILYFFLLFTFNFPAEEIILTRNGFLLITIPFLIAASLSLIPGQIVGEIYRDSGYNIITLGSGYPAYALYIVGYFTLGFINLVKGYRRANGIIKIQLAYIFFGILIPALAGVILDLFFPWFGRWRYIWVGPATTIFISICIFWAMRKYRLFNLKIIFRGNQYLALIKKGEEGDLLEKAKRGY